MFNKLTKLALRQNIALILNHWFFMKCPNHQLSLCFQRICLINFKTFGLRLRLFGFINFGLKVFVIENWIGFLINIFYWIIVFFNYILLRRSCCKFSRQNSLDWFTLKVFGTTTSRYHGTFPTFSSWHVVRRFVGKWWLKLPFRFNLVLS